MARKCQITNKQPNNGYSVSHSHRRSKRLQNVNLQYQKIWCPSSKRYIRMRISTKAIKSLQRKSLDQF
uniref:Large ribosomal subunit protein bL28c n=1 Tax=Glaucocystis incrassata TaxID=1789788 RepID=A0A3G1IVV8_9EUKA|nr:ribosomal protein L28 [Glaucocystis incrassata]ASQ40069.1 ribosomal protein L28 [Glaucocystis incrassata]